MAVFLCFAPSVTFQWFTGGSRGSGVLNPSVSSVGSCQIHGQLVIRWFIPSFFYEWSKWFLQKETKETKFDSFVNFVGFCSKLNSPGRAWSGWLFYRSKQRKRSLTPSLTLLASVRNLGCNGRDAFHRRSQSPRSASDLPCCKYPHEFFTGGSGGSRVLNPSLTSLASVQN